MFDLESPNMGGQIQSDSIVWLFNYIKHFKDIDHLDIHVVHRKLIDLNTKINPKLLLLPE